jgi:hypothetical protein
MEISTFASYSYKIIEIKAIIYKSKIMSSIQRLTPKPEFKVDWATQLEVWNKPNTRIVMKAMTWQGIWGSLCIAKPRNGKSFASYFIEEHNGSGDLHLSTMINPDDIESVKTAITGFLQTIWDSTICTGCEDQLTEGDKEYCEGCIEYTSSGMCFNSEHDCIICIENRGNIRKLCPCGKYICITCWNKYEKQDECPACRQSYPTMKKRKRDEDSDSD